MKSDYKCPFKNLFLTVKINTQLSDKILIIVGGKGECVFGPLS